MALNYTSLQAALLADMAKAQPPYTLVPGDFAQEFPQAIAYAEGRIYRDVPLLANRQQNTTALTVANSRAVTLPSGLMTPEAVALLIPSTQANPSLATRVPYDMASLDVIDWLWPVEATTIAPTLTNQAPRYWALRDNLTIVLCPTPDAAYTVEITGLFQPAAMSATNTTTYLGTVYPDLLEAACMVYLSGALMHNFGAQSDDPRQAMSWEAIYNTLLPGVKSEEMRRRGLVPNVPH